MVRKIAHIPGYYAFITRPPLVEAVHAVRLPSASLRTEKLDVTEYYVTLRKSVPSLSDKHVPDAGA